jgi:hypothetical protein
MSDVVWMVLVGIKPKKLLCAKVVLLIVGF